MQARQAVEHEAEQLLGEEVVVQLGVQGLGSGAAPQVEGASRNRVRVGDGIDVPACFH